MFYRTTIFAGAFVLLLLFGCAFAQQTTGSSGTPAGARQFRPEDIPLPVLYKHFWAHLRQLDSEADQLESTGKDGSKYRRYYQDRLKFSDVQFGHVRDAAHAAQQTDDIDQKAKQIIVEFRKQFAHGSVSSDGSLPPVPQELRDLKIQRDQLLSSQVAGLKQQLGPQTSAALDSLVKSDFGAHASVQPVVALSQQQSKPRNPNLRPLDSAPYQQ